MKSSTENILFPKALLARTASLLLLGATVAYVISANAAAAATAADTATAPGQSTTEKAENLFLKGVKSYREGRLADAIGFFEAAAAKAPSPTLLYDIAVLSDKAGNTGKAVDYYLKYLETDPDDASLIRQRLNQLAPDAIARLDASMTGSAGSLAPAAANTSKEDNANETLLSTAGGTTSPASPDFWPYVSYIGSKTEASTIGVLSVGLAAMGLGGFFGYKAMSSIEDFNNSVLRSEAEQARDAVRSNASIANISYGIGAVALTAAAVMFIGDIVPYQHHAMTPAVNTTPSAAIHSSLPLPPIVPTLADNHRTTASRL